MNTKRIASGVVLAIVCGLPLAWAALSWKKQAVDWDRVEEMETRREATSKQLRRSAEELAECRIGLDISLQKIHHTQKELEWVTTVRPLLADADRLLLRMKSARAMRLQMVTDEGRERWAMAHDEAKAELAKAFERIKACRQPEPWQP